MHQEAEKNITANVTPWQTSTGLHMMNDEQKCCTVKSGKCLIRDQSRYNKILCIVSSFIHQWIKTSDYLAANGEDEYKIACILGKIMQVSLLRN
jgi:hypothetical protein